MKSSLSTKPTGHGSLYKEVRFSPTSSRVHHTDLPASNPSSTLDANYLDQVRSLLDRQRANFEAERELFAGERRLWEKEKVLLRSRISELEASLSGRGTVRRMMGPPEAATNPIGLDRFGSSLPDNSSQAWEKSNPGNKRTRVFHESEKLSDEGSLWPSLDAALSPRSRATNVPTGACVPVPIEKLDGKLDGITLKSSALSPEAIARVMTPPSPAQRQKSPSASSQSSPAQHKNTLKLKLSELGPPDKNLTRDAGHTPMAAIVDAEADTDQPPSPSEGHSNGGPVAAPAASQPAENSESYFPDLPEDPSLKGPLSLLNDEEHDSGFLQELNQKLLDETRQAPSDDHSSNGKDVDPPSQGEQEPELRFKNTTNFGTAFGKSDCRRC